MLGLDDVEQYAELPETGLTFGENALIKAREGCRQSGLPTIADDSGLAVDALNGMPGVFSARWSGQHGDDRANLELVLAQIADVPDEQRGAAFVCAVALVLPGGREHLVEGRQSGRILRAPRGDGGFGYDPIFLGDGQDRTNAELTRPRRTRSVTGARRCASWPRWSPRYCRRPRAETGLVRFDTCGVAERSVDDMY